MPSPQGSPRRGRPPSASGTPPRSPARGRGATPRDVHISSEGPTNASSSRPRVVDTVSPATRATLLSTPVADLVGSSPLAPLAFDLRKLASQTPSRAKDTAIVALSAQLDLMRARLRAAESAAGSQGSPVSGTVLEGRAVVDDTTNARTPPASPPRAGARPATPPRNPSSSAARRLSGPGRNGNGISDAPAPRAGVSGQVSDTNTTPNSSGASWQDRAHAVALLRLETEAREWRARLESAERREKEALAETKVLVEKTRLSVLAECAIDTRQLEVLKYRALARGTTKLLERKARLAFSAFRRCVRDASQQRRVERELVPKWNKRIVPRLAFAWFRSAVAKERATRIAGERTSLKVVLGHARRVTLAWFGVTKKQGALRRKAARCRAALFLRGSKRLSNRVFTAWRQLSHSRSVIKRKVLQLYTRNKKRRHVNVPFFAWRHETRRESETETHAAELNATATSVRVYRFTGRRVFRKQCVLLRQWQLVATERLQLRVGIARARNRWRRARGVELLRAWRIAKRATRLGISCVTRRAFRAWYASARGTQFANAIVARGTRRRAQRGVANTFVAWARAVAPSRVAAAEKRVAAAEAAATAALDCLEKCQREAKSDRDALAEALTRNQETTSALAHAERRSSALAPSGGGVLETPLGWRLLDPANAAREVAELVASPTGKESGKDVGKKSEKNSAARAVASNIHALMDPCPPVFIPDKDPYALDSTEDGSPASSGVSVTLLPGGDVVSFAALSVSTPALELVNLKNGLDGLGEKENAIPPWNIDPCMAWCTAGTVKAVKGTPPVGRENPATCFVPAATAAVAAAAAGTDPAGVVGGVFLYGGFDACANVEVNDAYLLLHRVSDPDDSGPSDRAVWEWIELKPDESSVKPPARSHACVFATPAPFSGSQAARDTYATGEGFSTDIWLLGGYQQNASSGGLRNDLWRLDTSTLTWSSPTHFGDVPSPRRDAAVAVTSMSRSGSGRVFVHGGCAGDGEPLACLFSLDLGTLMWTRLPPGDDILASDPFESMRRDLPIEPEFGVAAEIAAVLAQKADQEDGTVARPMTSYPSARSRHAATVIGSSLVVHGGRAPAIGDASQFSKYANDQHVYVLCLETMSWRAPRVISTKQFPSPPTNRSVGHGLFPHIAGVVFVGGGALATPPPVFLLELSAQRAGRKIQADAVRDELKLLVTSDAHRKVTKEVRDTKAELERVQAIAQKVKADADVMAVAEKQGREAQRLLLKKLKDSRDKISGARDLVTAAREETSIFRNRVDVAFAKEKKARREATEAQLEIAEAEGRASVAETKAIDALNEARRREQETLAILETKDAQDAVATNHEIVKLVAELERVKAHYERAESARHEAVEELRLASAKAAAGREALAQAEDRARLAEFSRASVLRDARDAREALRLEMEILEERTARATTDRWQREADDAVSGKPRRERINGGSDDESESESESGSDESSVDEETEEQSGSDATDDAEEEDDLPSRLVSMLNVENMGR